MNQYTYYKNVSYDRNGAKCVTQLNSVFSPHLRVSVINCAGLIINK
jgi:hypothetical protein